MVEQQNYKVLLVEDDLVDQLAFKRAVRENNLNFDYQVATSVREAEEVLSGQKFDLLITDYHLGDGTAFDYIENVRDIPVIFVTGGGDEELAVRAMKLGAYDYLIKDAEHNYLRLLPITARNAINHYRSLEQLRFSERRYRDLFEGTTDLIQSVSQDGKVKFVNRAWKETLGYSEEEALNQSIFEFIHPDYHDHCKNLLSDMFENGPPDEIQIAFLTKDQRKLFVRGNMSIKDERGELSTVSIFHDITAQMAVEASLKRVNEELEKKVEIRTTELRKSNQDLRKEVDERTRAEEELIMINDELSTFIYKISHDIRSPLTSILGLVNIAKIEADNESSLNYINLIEGRVKMLDSILSKLTNVSRIRQGLLERDAIDFEHLIRDILDSIEHIPGFDRIKVDFKVGLPKDFISDQSIVNTILHNLIVNAVKYQRADEQRPFLQISISNHEDEICIEASDNGTGLDPNVKDKVFDMFYRGTNLSDGTGLGLFIVKKAVKKLNGRIEVESEVGKGSSFKVFLPYQQEEILVS